MNRRPCFMSMKTAFVGILLGLWQAAFAAVSSPTTATDLVHFPPPHRSDISMSLIFDSVAGIEVAADAELACLTPDGIVAGAMVFGDDPAPWGMAVWHDDFMTDTLDGFREGEPLSFLYWDPIHNWELNVGFDVIEGSQAVFTGNGYLVLGMTVGVNVSDAHFPTQFQVNPPFPNPFNSFVTIPFSVPTAGEMKAFLFDSQGALTKTIVQGLAAPGDYSIELSSEKLPAGTYLLRLYFKDASAGTKLILLK